MRSDGFGAVVSTLRGGLSRARNARIAPAAVTALTVVSALLLLPPWIPSVPSADLDSSWALAFSYAFNHGWQFGKDVVFTYGPYAFLYAKLFDPDNYSLSLGIWVGAAALFGFAVSALFEGVRPVWRLAAVVGLLVAFRSGTWAVLFFSDPFFFLIPYTFALIAFHPRPIVPSALAPALLVLSALAGLVKFTYLLFGFACVVFADLHRLRRRALPWYSVGYLAAVLSLFVLAGQKPATFPDYLRASFAVAAGYSEAMQLSGPLSELVAFIAIAGGLLLLVHRAECAAQDGAKDRWLATVPLLMVLSFIFIIFKASFVRHDEHSAIAWSSITAAMVLYASRLSALHSKPRQQTALAGLCVLALVLAVDRHCDIDQEPVGRFLNANFGNGLLKRIDAVGQLALGRHRSEQMQRYETALALIRSLSRVPAASGTVDAMPWNAAVVIANGLQYHPRPVIESYNAYNGSLIGLNRAFLRSDAAPSSILFDVGSIDNRLPAQDDGAAWPDLVAHYDAQEAAGSTLLLKRRESIRTVRLTPIALPVTSTWDTVVPVPGEASLVWTRIEISKTFIGRLVDFVFRLPVINLVITFGDGTVQSYRLVPEIARHGFLLSPVVTSGRGFAQLLRKDSTLLKPARRVRSIQIQGGDAVTLFYDASVRFDFDQLSFDE